MMKLDSDSLLNTHDKTSTNWPLDPSVIRTYSLGEGV